MRDSATKTILFIAALLILAGVLMGLLAFLFVEPVDAQVTWESQPINVVPQLKSAGFTPEQIQALMAAFGQINVTATNSQRQQDETIRSLRDSVYGIQTGGAGCTTTVEMMNECAYDSVNDPFSLISNDKIRLNTYALQLEYLTPEFDPSPYDYSNNPTMRFITLYGDTNEITTPFGVGDDNSFDYTRVSYAFPTSVRAEPQVMVWTATGGSGDGEQSVGDGGVRYGSDFQPWPGIIQYGRQAANKTASDWKDTVVFANTRSDTSSSITGLSIPGSIGAQVGRKYGGNTYIVHMAWEPQNLPDSLWVESKTDSSFVVRMTASTATRTFTFIIVGYEDPFDYP